MQKVSHHKPSNLHKLRHHASIAPADERGPRNAASQPRRTPPNVNNAHKHILADLVSRITIAGIEDVYKARNAVERYMFVLAIAFGLLAMSYSSALIGIRYSDQDPTVINRAVVLYETAPFPNITTCLPLLKNPNVRELLVFPENVLRRMARLNVSIDDVARFMEFGTSAYYGDTADRNPITTVVSIKVVDAALERNDRFLIDATKSPCDKSFSNCSFGGRPFDCCEMAEYMILDQGSCWHFDINKVERMSESIGATSDPLNFAYKGLAMDLSIDETLVIPDDNVLRDGFLVHIDQIPSLLSTPEVIPFGADARIVLAEPVHLRELTGCVSIDALPHLRRYEYYDQNKVFCMMEKSLDFMANMTGCEAVPFLTFVPSNESRCGAQSTFMALRALSGNMDLPEETGQVFFRNIMNAYKSCLPHCTRWSYSSYSSSYGYIQYRPDIREARKNTSMTRLRIYFQSSAYQQRTEERTDLARVAFCQIGAVWAVYLGFSIVSIVQALAYVAILGWKRWIRVVPPTSQQQSNDTSDNGSGRGTKMYGRM